jgi:hypothetical protein
MGLSRVLDAEHWLFASGSRAHQGVSPQFKGGALPDEERGQPMGDRRCPRRPARAELRPQTWSARGGTLREAMLWLVREMIEDARDVRRARAATRKAPRSGGSQHLIEPADNRLGACPCTGFGGSSCARTPERAEEVAAAMRSPLFRRRKRLRPSKLPIY